MRGNHARAGTTCRHCIAIIPFESEPVFLNRDYILGSRRLQLVPVINTRTFNVDRFETINWKNNGLFLKEALLGKDLCTLSGYVL